MPPEDNRITEAAQRHWRRSVRVMGILLVVWAVAGLGCGVLFADVLNQWSLGGFPLGFWFAQQGSVIVFVIVILVFACVLNRIDARFHEEIRRSTGDDS